MKRLQESNGKEDEQKNRRIENTGVIIKLAAEKFCRDVQNRKAGEFRNLVVQALMYVSEDDLENLNELTKVFNITKDGYGNSKLHGKMENKKGNV